MTVIQFVFLLVLLGAIIGTVAAAISKNWLYALVGLGCLIVCVFLLSIGQVAPLAQ